MIIIIYVLSISTSKAINLITVDQRYLDSKTLLQLNSEEYMITQSVTNATFYYQPQEKELGKYIVIELMFQFPENGKVNMQFSVTKNNLAVQKNKSLLASYQDLNGFYLQKAYQFIQIPSFSFSSRDKFFITDISNDTSSLYTLKISESAYQMCPGMCGGVNGQCLSSSGLCSCVPDKIDLDCSLNAQQIIYGSLQTHSFQGGKFYLYYEFKTEIDSGTFTFDLENDEQVTVYFLFENFTIGAPSEFYNDFSFQCTEKTKKQYLLNFEQLNYNGDLQRYERLLIAVYSKQPISFTTLIDTPQNSSEQSQQSGPMYIYFLIGLGILLILICFIIAIIRCRRQSTQIRDINSHGTLNSTPNRRKSRQSKYQEAIDEFMPKIFYRTATHVLNESLPNDFSCPMCLVQYEDTSVCRITPCKHIFHSNCICQWLFLHQNCPMCRSELDEKSLELLQYETQGFFQQIVRLKRKRHEAKISNIIQESGQSGVRLTLEQL